MVHLCEQAFLQRHQALGLHSNIKLDHNRVMDFDISSCIACERSVSHHPHGAAALGL